MSKVITIERLKRSKAISGRMGLGWKSLALIRRAPLCCANNRLASLKVTVVLKLAEFDPNGMVDLKLTPGNSLTCWLAPKLATLRYL